MKKGKWNKLYGSQTCMKNMHHTSRNSTVWPEAFERMEQFIRDTGLSRDIIMLF